MKSKLYIVLIILGIFSLVISFIFWMLSLSAYLERAKYGPGLFFADVEFFGIVAIVSLLFGLVFLFISRRIKKSNSK